MQHKTRIWVALLSTLGLGAVSAVAQAQDYPTHKGDNARVGRNALPFANGPGIANVRWWHPDITEGLGGGSLRDNTSSLTTVVGAWGNPPLNGEASYPYIPIRTGTVAVDALISSWFDPASPNFVLFTSGQPIQPAYRYATSVASLSQTDYDPTVPATGTADTFTWDVTPTDGVARNYGVYVWLPAGPTTIGGTLTYPQRYFVYSIQYGANNRFVDVVDTSVAGTGWVRLGNGGKPTNRMFHYSGVGTMTVTLYNTVARNSSGDLLEAVGGLVYADAAALFTDYGSYSASPIISTLTSGAVTCAVAAHNSYEVGVVGSVTETLTKGAISSYVIGTGAKRWTYTPLDESDLAVNLDMPSSQVTVNPPDWTAATIATGYRGVNYYAATLVTDVLNASNIVYTPTLAAGDYDIYVWLAGSNSGEQFATGTAYVVHEGLTQTTVYVDQSTQKGWVRLGTRRWANTPTAPLSVEVLNYSDVPADAALGRKAYADAVRFVGAANLAINSTPLQIPQALIKMDTNAADPPVPTDVTIVAAENGRLYCLDATGNGDGSTNVYWTYPSTPDPTNASWTDPNQVASLDGVGGIAEMPTHSGFDLSSALVQRIGGRDLLYIAAQNGRVYCIDVTGRGDMNLATRQPGTTRRMWSFPNDFPATAVTSSLGAFEGSLAFTTTAQGPTIIVPAPQGRVYALDAVGNTTTLTTTVRWQYPAATAPTLGRIVSTPAVEFGNVYFGTMTPDDGSNGVFYALNANNGNVVWTFDGTTLVPADDFVASPATAPAALFNQAGFPQNDTVFAANENGYIYALDAGTGNVIWSTNELGTGVQAALSFVPLTVFSNAGGFSVGSLPILMVPTTDGRLVGLFADGLQNRFGTKRAYEYDAGPSFVASTANGRGWLMAATTNGLLYAFSNDAGAPISPGNPPGSQTIVENDQSGDAYREAVIKFIGELDYRKLRTSTTGTDPAAVTYAEINGMAPVTGTPLAFEWGETIYALVYNFPYATATPNNTPVPPPIVNYAFSVQGGSVRNISVESRVAAAAPDAQHNGWAVLAYALQTGGQTSLAPGSGKLTVTITTSALNNAGTRQTIALNPQTSSLTFYIANPLALLMDGTTDLMRAIGFTTNPGDAENLINGSRKTGSGTKDTTRLLSSVGLVAHGKSGFSTIGVVDRSMMTKLRGPGRGLDTVRYQRNGLAFNGGMAAVNNYSKPLDPVLYQNYEDYPIHYPNDSLDYPDIGREAVLATKQVTGNVENPLFNGVSLLPPTFVDPTVMDPATRTLVPTPFQLEVDVPRFQPPDAWLTLDSAGSSVNAGYLGRQYVFVSSTGSDTLVRGGGRRDAYRSFILSGNVDIDEKVTVDTPTVDAGSLPGGAGFSPFHPWDQVNNKALNPVSGLTNTYDWSWLFHSFVVKNPGNVNLRRLHVAKAVDYGTDPLSPWPIYSAANHELAWLDPQFNVFSSLDNDIRWRVVDDNGNVHPSVALQKARVGDRVPTELDVNTPRRTNTSLGVLSGYLVERQPLASLITPFPPSIAATIPIGLPAGTYAQTMRIINEDSPLYRINEALSLDQYGVGLETYSDPTFILRFNVRETRLTNSFTTGTAPMMDNLVVGGERFLHSNLQPTAMRSPSGSVVVAWASTRPSFTAPEPGANLPQNPMWQIYMGTLVGTTPGTAWDPVQGWSPLRELNFFTPNTDNRWFQQSTSAPYPTCTTTAEANALFGVDAASGESVLFDPTNNVNTVGFGSPTFPTTGFDSASGPGTYMAFVGEAQIQTPTGRNTVSRLFLAPTLMDSSGVATLGAPILMSHDDGAIRKNDPSVVQVGQFATVFFSGGASGQSQLMYATYDPTVTTVADRWSNIIGISTGTGFESVASPSVFRRVYAGPSLTDLPNGTNLLEMTFTGKLRGRPNSEVFFGRMLADGSGRPIVRGGVPRFSFLPLRTTEPLVNDGNNVFRAEGVAWNVQGTIQLQQMLDGTLTDIEIRDAGGNPTTRTFDRTTGLLSFDTKLGGKVYVDPNMGTVKFSSAVPSKRATLLLTYQPRFIRVSGAGVDFAHNSPTILFDHRLIGDASYWARQTGAGVRNSDTDAITTDRYVFTYGRSAGGGVQAARPFIRTMRFGVQLPTPIATNADGTVKSLVVSGNTGPYEVDPVNGRVYFTDVDENQIVNVTYTGTDTTGKVDVVVPAQQLGVTLVPERAETPVTIEQAVNESGLDAFLDPLDPGGQIGSRRPGLIWLFWTSTRAGAPDLYFETIAPRFTPVPAGK